MKTRHHEKPARLKAGLRITFLGLIALLLLTALLPEQSAWPSGGPPTSLQSAPPVRPGNLSQPVLGLAASRRENLARPPVRTLLVTRPASGFHQNLAVLPATSVWRLSKCPLPPASAFHLQTNLRQYLETWPTPGSTTTDAWPEYVPEDGEDVD
jgi:hypothetical protein